MELEKIHHKIIWSLIKIKENIYQISQIVINQIYMNSGYRKLFFKNFMHMPK